MKKYCGPISYEIDNELGIVRTTWCGTITAEDLRRYWKEYLADPQVRAVRRSVADIRNADFKFSGKELSNVVNEVVMPLIKDLEWRVAIVVAQPVQYGVSNQFRVFAEVFNSSQIFYDPDEAIAWIRE